jgi:uncharacterized protein YcbK (DUF882 family)
MAHTVVGIFQSSSQAQEAAEFFDGKGIQRSEVRESEENDLVDANTKDTSKMNKFFEDLLQNKSNSFDAKRGNSFIIIYGTNASEAKYAADVLMEYGAVEVHEEDNEGSSTTETL